MILNKLLINTRYNLFSDKMAIVTYHNMVKNFTDDYLFDMGNVSCDLATFEKQMIFFKKYFDIIPYSKLNEIDRISSKKPIMVIVFDDGYSSFYHLAYPTLKKYNIPVTVFIPTNYIDDNTLFWWDEINLFSKLLGPEAFFKRFITPYFIAETYLQYLLNNKDYYEYHLTLLKYLKKYTDKEIELFINEVRVELKTELARSIDYSPVELLNWEQIRSLSFDGVDFGSHTCSHCRFEITSKKEIENELKESLKIIQKKIGKVSPAFCYPGGMVGNLSPLDLSNIFKKNNLHFACTMEVGLNDITVNPYLHKRIPVDCKTTNQYLFDLLVMPEKLKIKSEIKEIIAKTKSLKSKLKIASRILLNGQHKSNVTKTKHIFISICDHFEPYWDWATHATAENRVNRWCVELPKILKKHYDSDGKNPRYDFFYPIEEYKKHLFDSLTELCRNGYGEVNVHLHHDNDTPENLKNNLIHFKKLLASQHGLLSKNKKTNDICFGFIHGNWTLDNSGVDKRWCGVNNELDILMQTGCFADFTMPSAPDDTQTNKMNSIYYAIDDPLKPKSHDTGIDAEVGLKNQSGLLMIQGPLSLIRKKGLKLGIENSGLQPDNPITARRIDKWISQGISVKKKPDWLFVKLYTHGTQEPIMDSFFNNNQLEFLFQYLEQTYNDGKNYCLHYVSAREMTNIIHALEFNNTIWDNSLRDFLYLKNS